MQGFYNVTTKIREELEKDEFCKTVTYGDIFNVDLKKVFKPILEDVGHIH